MTDRSEVTGGGRWSIQIGPVAVAAPDHSNLLRDAHAFGRD
jgi:hypothetical protein